MVVYEPLQQYDTAHTAKAIYRKPWTKHGSSIDENSVLNDVYAHFPYPAYKCEYEKQQYIRHECIVSVIVTVNYSLVGKSAEMRLSVYRKTGVLLKFPQIVKRQRSLHYSPPPFSLFSGTFIVHIGMLLTMSGFSPFCAASSAISSSRRSRSSSLSLSSS